MEGSRNLTALVGRLLLALIFVMSGFGKLTNLAGTAGYMEHAGMLHALVYPALLASIAVELGFGVLLMIGFRARMAAVVMFLWFIPVTIMFHFLPWREAVAHGDKMGAMMQQINYMKNISIMGGLLLIVSFGSGAWSVDGGK
ncbi:MAG: DoxX family protein [Candidatus Binataceae bacterium]|jgi:putative oxidoreductase